MGMYEDSCSIDFPLMQGDIIQSIPFYFVNPAQIRTIIEKKTEVIQAKELSIEGQDITCNATKQMGIILTQSCDLDKVKTVCCAKVNQKEFQKYKMIVELINNHSKTPSLVYLGPMKPNGDRFVADLTRTVNIFNNKDYLIEQRIARLSEDYR